MQKQQDRKSTTVAAQEKRGGGNLTAISISLLSLCIALSSLTISYKNYLHSQTERLTLSVFPQSANRNVNLVESTSLPDIGYLFAFWDCLFINTGDRPLTVVSFDVREQLSVVDRNEAPRDYSVAVDFYDDEDQEIKLPITLGPAESRLLRANIPLQPDPQVFKLLSEDFEDASNLTWDAIQTNLFFRSIDIYGNKWQLVETVPNAAYSLGPNPRDQRFEFSFVTARGAKFKTVASLYGRSSARVLGRY
jgi:hypothetical protein